MQSVTERAENPVDFWEDHYRTKRTGYSGHPGEFLVRYVADLTPGRALDIGCSHGDDALWLAGRVLFVACDLERVMPGGEYDLVAASYFQSPVALARADIFRRAMAKLVPGGYFLSIAHASAPPWRKGNGEHQFPTLQQELDGLELRPDEWILHKAGYATRTVTGPEGEKAEVKDIVLFFERGGTARR